MNDAVQIERRGMDVRRATFYFALVYFSQGMCQAVTLLNQPTRMYLEKVGHLSASGISNFLFVTTLPWMIKPLYGMLSDFFPLFGYRRKSYLLLLNLLAAVAFFLVAGIQSVGALTLMLTLTGVGVAASDVVVDAMMVQAGQETGRTRLFQGAQWFSINVAAILSGLLASAICGHWANSPSTALRVAALIAMVVPLVVAVLTWLMVEDQPARINVPEFLATGKALLGAFANGRLWFVVLFLFLVNFNPGTITAMYSHLEENVHLPHSFLAVLDTVTSGGQVVGALIFTFFLSGKLSVRKTVGIGLATGALGMVPLLFIHDRTSAIITWAIWGVTYIIAMLSQLTVAAEACPKRVEGVVFAALMSVFNFSVQGADVVGSKLYEGFLGHRLNPLILLSIGLTAAGLVFVPFLRPAREAEKDPSRGFEVVQAP